MSPHQRMREFRRARGWTQPELGDHIGMSYSMISMVESGKKRLGGMPAVRLFRLTMTGRGKPISVFDWESWNDSEESQSRLATRRSDVTEALGRVILQLRRDGDEELADDLCLSLADICAKFDNAKEVA